MNALHRLLDLEYTPDGLRRLIDEGVDPNERAGVTGETALHVAVRRRRLDAVGPLLDAGAEIDATTTGGKTAWVHAYRRGFGEVAAALAARGADDSRTPSDDLSDALMSGDLDTAKKLLVENEGLAASLNSEEARVLADVTGYDFLEAATLLLDHGAPIDARGLDGGTALHQASWFGAPRVARLLIDRGAALEIHCEDHDLTPLGWLCHGSRYSGGAEERTEVYAEIGAMLVEAGADRAVGSVLGSAAEPVRRILDGGEPPR